jgi:uracil-DNA glycosylase family 4
MADSRTIPAKPFECRACPWFDRRRVPSEGSREAKVMLVGDYPSLTTPEMGQPFSDRRGVIFKTALARVESIYKKSPEGRVRWDDLKQYRTYMVQCVSDDKPPKEPAARCKAFFHEKLVEIQPKIVVVFGATAFNALGLSGRVKFSDVRGTFQEYSFPRGEFVERFKIFVTFSLDAVLAKPGIYDDLVRDLLTAFRFTEDRQVTAVTREELTKDYIIPRTVEEVEAVCARIIDYAHEGDSPELHLIGCDTETDRLEMYDPEAKMIVSSFSWEPGHAAAILVDHPRAWWTPEELVRVHAAVRRVWACAKPKVLHHEKFDRQVVEGRYEWELANVVWDTMCGEHLIEEDKKGQYGLKVLSRTRLPRYAGYDDKVDEIRQAHGGLSRVDEAKRYRKALVAYEEKLRALAPLQQQYDKACEVYQVQAAEWDRRRVTEKEEARKEKRRMNKDAYGKKPTKPRKPKEPDAPEHLPPFDFTLIPIDDLLDYAAIDADVCRQHVLHQNQRLNMEYAQDVKKRKQMGCEPPLPVKRLMRRHVMPLSAALAKMEFTGFPVDLPYLETIDEKLAKVVEETRVKLHAMAGDFVINNPQDVIAVMFQRGFYEESAGKRIIVPINDDLRRTKKGQIKADEKALVYVNKQYGYEFPKVLLTHRKATKARSPFLTNVRVHAQLLDGRMHPSFHITGTSTGRLSSSGENMQNCFSDDTEILTNQGWVRFDALSSHMLVAQFDAVTERISFVEPLEYVHRPVQLGEMRQVTLQQVDLRLTGAHEQLIRRQTGTYVKVAVDDLRSGSQFVHAGQYIDGVIDCSAAWITLVCATQADGSWNGYGWDFGFSKKRKIKRLREALDHLGVMYTESPRKRGGVRFYVRKQWAEKLLELLGPTKRFGSWLLDWTSSSRAKFLEEVMHWDGSFTRKNCYSSSVEANADWVQIVALLTNRRARKRCYTAHGGKPNWQVDIPQKRRHSWTNHLVRDTVDYVGNVYCVRVPTGNVIVRRNGKAVITGNCPKKLAGQNIKNIFVPPPGMTLVNTDAKGAEIRLFAAYSHDELLIKALLDGLDTHSFFTSKVWPDEPYEAIEKSREMVDEWYKNIEKKLPQTFSADTLKWAEQLVRRRTNCKRVVFGTLYGAMAAKIAETAGIPLEEAQEVINLMFAMFPSIPAYIQETQNEVLHFGSVYTKTGRKRRFPLANVRMFRNRCYRQAVNFKIQSTSSDIVLWVLCRVAPIILRDLRGELHATVHDSIAFSVPDAYLSQVPDMMQKHGTDAVAEQYPWLPIPFLWDIEVGKGYGSVSNIHSYLKGDKRETPAAEDLVEGDEIREEINAELRV